MDNLLDFINKMQSEKRFQALDEAAIKQGIVLKMLSLLDWDPFDMDEIQPEYDVKAGKIDLALIHKGKPKVFVGVKKETKDIEGSKARFLDWAAQCKVPMAVLTNGLSWRFFLSLVEGSTEDKEISTLEISDGEGKDIRKCISDFLSKKNVVTDRALKIAQDIYESRKRALIIEEHLPRAWEKILSEPEKWLGGAVSEVTEKLCGIRPDKEIVEAFIASKIRGSAENAFPKESAPSKNQKGQKDHEGKSVTSFTLEGKEYKVKAWKDVLLKLCEIMYERHKEDFESIQYVTLKGRDCFSENPHTFLDSGKIAGSGIYVDFALSQTAIEALCGEILSNFGHKEGEFIVETV